MIQYPSGSCRDIGTMCPNDATHETTEACVCTRPGVPVCLFHACFTCRKMRGALVVDDAPAAEPLRPREG